MDAGDHGQGPGADEGFSTRTLPRTEGNHLIDKIT